MITTDGLNHLALAVREPQRSAEFYAGRYIFIEDLDGYVVEIFEYLP